MDTVIPTLGDKLFLTQPNVQLTYVIRTFSIFPANTLPFFSKTLPSLGALAAEYGNTPDLLASRVQDAVATLLKNTFPTGNPHVEANTSTDKDSLKLSLRIVLDLNGNTYTEAAKATIKNGQVTIPNDEVF